MKSTRSGELLTEPVSPRNAPPGIFCNQQSRAWFESGTWPQSSFRRSEISADLIKRAINSWVSRNWLLIVVRWRNTKLKVDGTDLLKPQASRWLWARSISITLHHLGKSVTWKLPGTTSTNFLYSLAQRWTKAQYSSFSLRTMKFPSKVVPISETDTLSQTFETSGLLSSVGIEIRGVVPHSRESALFNVTFDDPGRVIRLMVPQSVCALSVLYVSLSPKLEQLTKFRLWWIC